MFSARLRPRSLCRQSTFRAALSTSRPSRQDPRLREYELDNDEDDDATKRPVTVQDPNTPAAKMEFPERDNLLRTGGRHTLTTYRTFFETPEMQSMREATIPNNWLGGRIPFSTNPSFKPPIPVSDATRNKIFAEHMKDPLTNTTHALAVKHGMSAKRIDAILRLKGMESAWAKQNIPLQTGYQVGMEAVLGVARSELPLTETTDMEFLADRSDVDQADALEAEEQRDASRQRYQHQYWEPVVEDGSKEPIVPGVLQTSKRAGKAHALFLQQQKASLRYMPKVEDSRNIMGRTPALQLSQKEGRAAVMFVDVKGKFIDTADLDRRKLVSDRKAAKESTSYAARTAKPTRRFKKKY